MSARTLLLAAVRRGDAETVVRLLDQDPGLVNAQSERGETPVLLAVYHRRPALVDVLVSRGASLDVFEAAARGDAARVRECLDRVPERIGQRSGDGWTALHLAAHFDRDEAVALLLARGADANARSTNSMTNTALHAALAGTARLALVERLLARGADVNAVQGGGYTPLHEAAIKGNVDAVALLLRSGADVRAATDDGRSALALAQEHGHDDVARLLLDAGA